MRRSESANYQVVESDPSKVIIRDLGPWDQYYTITNAADKVVAELTQKGILKDGVRLFYYDSEGDFDELLHEGGKFKGYAPAIKP